MGGAAVGRRLEVLRVVLPGDVFAIDDVGHQHGAVVVAAAGVRKIDQDFRHAVQEVVADDVADFGVGDEVAQAIAAQQVGIADFDFDSDHVDFDVGVETDAARDDVLEARLTGLRFGDQAGLQLLVDEAVVFAELQDAAIAHEVAARVADVGDKGMLVVKQQRRCGGAHALQLTDLLGLRVDGIAGRSHGVAEQTSDGGFLDAAVVVDVGADEFGFGTNGLFDGANRDARRHLATGVTTHAVGDDKEIQVRREEVAVLVVVALHADVGGAPGVDAGLHGRTSWAPWARYGKRMPTMVESGAHRKQDHRGAVKQRKDSRQSAPIVSETTLPGQLRYSDRMIATGFLAVVVALLAAGPVAEPPGIARVARSADRLTADLTLRDPVLAGCAKTYTKGNDIEDLPCRLAVAAAVSATPVTTGDDVKKRRDLLNDAVAVGDYVATLPPALVPTPGRRRARFVAHERACALIFSAAASLEQVPTGVLAYGEARQVLAAGDYQKKGCACAQATFALAVGADASPEEQSRAQGMLTAHQCLTGGAFEVAERQGPGQFSTGSEKMRAIADASAPAGRVDALARSRSVELVRCTDKGMKDGRVSDAKKLGTCACNVIKRWPMPLKKDDPKLAMDLEIAKGVALPIVVEGGKVTSCGEIAVR